MLLTGLLLIVMTGCGTQKQPTLDGRLLNYDLGESTLTDSSGREVPYQMQGVLGIPEEKNCPVVVLIHGAHPIEKASEDRYDTGFNYLAQSLSEQGNLVISMNVAINYSFEDGEPNGNERTRQVVAQQLERLKKAVDGDKEQFGYDLSGVGDFNKVVLMGHSRGGLDVLECMKSLPSDAQLAGIVSVAPATYKVREADFPNVPIGIIIPQMDGDVISLDGSDIYEELLADEQYTGDAELIYLKDANHAYFNTQLTQPDLNHNDADIAKLMPAEQQRSFLTGYLADFVKSVTTTGKPVFASASELESEAYGCDVLLRVHSGTEKRLYTAGNSASLVTAGAVTATQEIASSLPAEHTVKTFKMPGLAFDHYALQHIVWTEAGSNVTIPLAGGIGNSRFLDIDMAVDSTDLKNVNGQSMRLSFTDADGNTASYGMVGSSTAALRWQQGELVEQTGWDGKPMQEYSTYTPLVTLRIDLSQFSSINLSGIASLKLSWEESAAGSIMLRSISSVA